jgi:hypothetical protein
MSQHDIVDQTVNRLAEDVMHIGGLNSDIVALGKVISEIGIDGFIATMHCAPQFERPGEAKYGTKAIAMLKTAIAAYEISEVFKKHPQKQDAFLKILDAISSYQKIQIELLGSQKEAIQETTH